MNDQIYPKDHSTILMVDDMPANLELLSVMLKVRGYKVRAAVSGVLALLAVRNDPPDLILLDINMPEMNGYELCGKLKSDKKLKNIPVIFMSALSETIDKVKAFGAGGVDYITKPFQLEEVEARVETQLELCRQRAELQKNYDKLRELEKMRDSLVQMIIHDLRSPLTSISAFLELSKEDAKNTLSADSVRYIAEAFNETKRMIRMVGDVLDTSKMEEGQMKLQVGKCDLSHILKDGISGMKALFKGREVLFASPESPVTILADREIICRVFQNLLANAIKFMPKDGGLIRLGIEPSGDRVRVSVTDNGPGVAAKYRQKIFEKFAQAELSAANQRNSTGLGLTFCKLAVEAHGGRIGVDSKDGKGSTFWFELPVNGPVPRRTSTLPVSRN